MNPSGEMPDTALSITVLMAVYNGAEGLENQLQSLRAQDHQRWDLITSNDGSSDESAEILEQFADDISKDPNCASNRIRNLEGPCMGFAANFLSLLRTLEDEPDQAQTRCVAFADQDDIWLPDKMSRAIAALETCDRDHPVLYCSRTWVTNADLSNPRLSAARPRPLGFRNALIQNIAHGNTILLNPAATRLVLRAAKRVDKVVFHDWWVYQLVTGAGGIVLHDDIPSLLYRQHAANQVGANDRFSAQLRRVWMLLRGDFRDWNRIHMDALRCSLNELTEENRALLARFVYLTRLPLVDRLAALPNIGLYRQRKETAFAIWLATALKRI